MDIIRQIAGPQGARESKRDYSRVPEWLRTVGDTVGYLGHTAGNLIGDLSGKGIGGAVRGLFGGE